MMRTVLFAVALTIGVVCALGTIAEKELGTKAVLGVLASVALFVAWRTIP